MATEAEERAGEPVAPRVAPEPTLRRLPLYHRYLKTMLAGRAGAVTGAALSAEAAPLVEGARGAAVVAPPELAVSCTRIGLALRLDPTQVRKDIEVTGIVGRPRVGYVVSELVDAIERFLGWDNASEAFLVGAGSLGAALLGYEKFSECGLDIVAAFDSDARKIGTQIHGKYVLSLAQLPDLMKRMHVAIGIITVPAHAAQDVADLMVLGGVRAIWNFAPVQLTVPEQVIVRNEDLYCSLAGLSRQLVAQRS